MEEIIQSVLAISGLQIIARWVYAQSFSGIDFMRRISSAPIKIKIKNKKWLHMKQNNNKTGGVHHGNY